MKVIEGFGVAEVVDSDNPNFEPGDVVSGFTGWEEYSLIKKPEQLRKIQQDDGVPLSYYVGLLGMLRFGFFFFFCYSSNVLKSNFLRHFSLTQYLLKSILL